MFTKTLYFFNFVKFSFHVGDKMTNCVIEPVVSLAGVEPAAFRFEDECSIH
jgi:hypothetical protein